MRKRIQVLTAIMTALCLSTSLGAPTDPWSYEAVSIHPRWISFLQKVQDSYIEPVNPNRLSTFCKKLLDSTRNDQTDDPIDLCIASALYSLDQGLSSYSGPKKFAEEQARQTKKFIGIGLELDAKKARGAPIRLISTIANSPAQRAGLLPGDDIVEVDGVDTRPLNSKEVAFKLLRHRQITV